MSQRPRGLHPSRSFTRLESSPKNPLARGRASTLQNPPATDITDPLKSKIVTEEEEEEHVGVDVFVNKEEGEEPEESTKEPDVPDTFEELPIEIRSLTER